jgi:metallophosphoesterase superfamily enzyme
VAFLLAFEGALAFILQPKCGPAAGEPAVLVLADIHVEPLCPMADTWMRYVVAAARTRWNVTAVIVLGDLMASGGGEDGGEVSSFVWRLQHNRVRAFAPQEA